jgi:cytoskeletal protein RodZ
VEATGVLKLSGVTSLSKLIGVCVVGGSVAVGGATWTWTQLRPAATEPHGHAATVSASSSPTLSDRNLPRPNSAQRSSGDEQATSNPEPPTRDDRDGIEPANGHTNGHAKLSQPPSRPVAPESTFEEELVLIKQAKVDLDSGRTASALRRLNEHGARFPRGVFASEREALRILAQCSSGASASSRSSAERFVRTHPRSPLVDRVSRACGLQRTETPK